MKKIALLLLLYLASYSIGWAQSIFDNPITGTTPNTANPYTTGQSFNADITVSGIGRGTGISGTNANNRYNANGWSTGAIDLNDYFYFTLTPNAGRRIDFVSFVYTGQASSNGPTSFAFRSNRDNYTADIGSPDETGVTIDLSAAAYQDITSPITFRFYGFNAVLASGTYSINDFTFNGSTALPIALSSFEATIENSIAFLSFSTASERDNDYFSIERSADATRFEAIGQVKGAGDSNESKNYTFTDDYPLPGKNYYRLRQVDFDGKFSYSKVVSVNFGNTGGITLSPMPTSNELRVSLDKPSNEEGIWQVLDMSGRTMRSGTFPAETSDYQLNASDLSEGAYVFRLVFGQETMTKKFRKI